MLLKTKIAQDLSVPVDLIVKATKEAYKKIKHIEIPKRNGGVRKVQQPSRNLKIIQYWLINNAFVNLHTHPNAVAYRKACSIKDNAIKHNKGKYFLKLDFENFFPSITFKDFWPFLQEWHRVNHIIWELDSEAIDIIKRACFDKDKKLPVGYPSSPIISNIVMFKFDSNLIKQINADRGKYGKVVYTRYADDCVFSTNKIGASRQIYNFVSKFVKNNNSPTLRINQKKTKHSSSSGGSAFLTGLRICYDGHITIHKKYKDHVKLLLSLFRKKKLKKTEPTSLKGHINYIRHVDPLFYNKLQRKHFETIEVLFGKNK